MYQKIYNSIIAQNEIALLSQRGFQEEDRSPVFSKCRVKASCKNQFF